MTIALENVKLEAKTHGQLKGDRDDFDESYFNSHGCELYDAFMAGALAPATELYYRSKFAIESTKQPVGFLNLTMADVELMKHEAKIHGLNNGWLSAVKFVKEKCPGMGLKEAKGVIDTIRDEIIAQGGNVR